LLAESLNPCFEQFSHLYHIMLVNDSDTYGSNYNDHKMILHHAKNTKTPFPWLKYITRSSVVFVAERPHNKNVGKWQCTTYSEELNFKNDKVKTHGQYNGSNQP